MFEYREKLIAIIFIDMNSSNNKLKHSRVNLIETTTAIITTTSITTKMTTAVPSTTSATNPTGIRVVGKGSWKEREVGKF